MPVLFIRFESLGFREHGFLIPKRAKRLLSISLFLAFLYVLVALFVPGSISGFEASPSVPVSWALLFSAGSIVLAVIAAETVFRGYIQTEFEKALGTYGSITVVSVLFTLYMIPITLYSIPGSTELVRLSLPLLTGSLFLCFFFRETKTLLCPIAFATTVTLLETFTPLEPTAIEYTTLVSLLCYIFLVPIMQSFVEDVREQTARLEPISEIESEEAVEVNARAL